MKWPAVTLSEIAPPERSAREFVPDELVWHLNLDQIESGTGRIISKQRAPASEAGNSTFVFDQDHVLYSKLRPYLNKVVRPDEPGIATTELVPMRPRKGILESEFLKYYLRSDRFLSFANQTVAGAKMPRMIMDKFWLHEMPLPTPSEQRRIVEFLEQADELRQKRAEADQFADRILRALFHRMFGDPATNPKGWPRMRLECVVADTRNGLYKHADFYGRGMQILKMFNIHDGRLNLERVDRVEVTQDEYDAYALEPGDILVNRVNTPGLVGKCAVISDALGPAVFESKNIRVRVRFGEAEPNYVAHFLNTSFGHGTLCQGVKHAIGMATINNSDLRNCQLPLPPIARQREWAKHVASVRKLTAQSESSKKNLEQLFGVLLHRAFTGELTAKWREAHMKEVLDEMEQQARLLNLSAEA